MLSENVILGDFLGKNIESCGERSGSGSSRGKKSSVAGKGPARGVVGERTQVLLGKCPARGKFEEENLTESNAREKVIRDCQSL
jgi:hypothetical protein